MLGATEIMPSACCLQTSYRHMHPVSCIIGWQSLALPSMQQNGIPARRPWRGQAYRSCAVWKRATQVQGSRPFTDSIGHIALPALCAEVMITQGRMHALHWIAVVTYLAGDLHNSQHEAEFAANCTWGLIHCTAQLFDLGHTALM